MTLRSVGSPPRGIISTVQRCRHRGGIVNVSSMIRTAQMEINVCSDTAQTCWVTIPMLYSNGHRRECATTY
jgi:hypothetical protein